MKPSRRTGFAAVRAAAESAGTIASSSGRARVAPTPLRNVRRARCFFVMIMGSVSLPKGGLQREATTAAAGASPVGGRRIWNGVLFTMPRTMDEKR